MRPGQNKRMRGRNNNNNSNNNRKGPNPLTRSYESNGPDVKIRGTAHHIGEKYLQLARDAQSSGDPVMAESYLQHAEHYFRLIASAQQAQQQAAYGYQRQPGEPEQDEDADDDFESLPDRFASPSERAPQQNHQNQPPPQPYQPQQDRPPYANGGQQQQPYEARQNYDRQNQPQPNLPQGDRQPQPERPQNYDRNQDRTQDRTYDNRNGRNDRGDRNAQQDRGQQDRNQQDRGQQDRGNGQGYQGGNGQPQADRNQGDRPPRDYDNRNYRNNRGPRDFRDGQTPREPRQQPQVDETVGGGLPAFITAPMRSNVPESANEQPPVEAEVPVHGAAEAGDEAGLHLRPRRRRRPKGEFANGDGGDSRPEPQEAGETTGD